MNPEKPKSGGGQTASILVVDDTPANLQVLAGMLKDRGYKVRPVPSGKLALLAAQRDPPNLILLDINMPEMNGYEVCEHLKADDTLKGIPVIFISALTEQLDKVKAFATGGVDYITKPFQLEELHARVETHLKLRRLQIELEEANVRLAKANGRMSRDLKAAAKIQETFLPGEVPRVSGADFAWFYRPCDELAGDGLNIIPLGDGKFGLYILDVSGHGVASALLSVTLSRLLSPPSEPSSILTRDRELRGRFDITPPAEVAGRLNQLFPFDLVTEQFATMVYGILNSSTGEFRYVSAGHPWPGASALRPCRSCDSGEPGLPHRPGRRRLRGAVGPPGSGRSALPLLRRCPRGDGPCRQAVRRRPALGGDRTRAVRTAQGRCCYPSGGNHAVVWNRELTRRSLHVGGRGVATLNVLCPCPIVLAALWYGVFKWLAGTGRFHPKIFPCTASAVRFQFIFGSIGPRAVHRVGRPSSGIPTLERVQAMRWIIVVAALVASPGCGWSSETEKWRRTAEDFKTQLETANTTLDQNPEGDLKEQSEKWQFQSKKLGGSNDRRQLDFGPLGDPEDLSG